MFRTLVGNSIWRQTAFDTLDSIVIFLEYNGAHDAIDDDDVKIGGCFFLKKIAFNLGNYIDTEMREKCLLPKNSRFAYCNSFEFRKCVQ